MEPRKSTRVRRKLKPENPPKRDYSGYWWLWRYVSIILIALLLLNNWSQKRIISHLHKKIKTLQPKDTISHKADEPTYEERQREENLDF